MSSLELRPRFKRTNLLKPQQIIERIRDYAQNGDSGVETSIIDNHVIFSVSKDEQNYWSPQLSLQVHEDEQGSLLRGLFGPHPKVWTMFMFLYTGLGFIGLIGLMYGLVQWSLGMAPVALWVALAAVILEITFYFIARTGKQLAYQQMLQLQKALDAILK